MLQCVYTKSCVCICTTIGANNDVVEGLAAGRHMVEVEASLSCNPSTKVTTSFTAQVPDSVEVGKVTGETHLHAGCGCIVSSHEGWLIQPVIAEDWYCVHCRFLEC